MKEFLSQNVRVKDAGGYTAAGTTTITSSAIDLQSENADGVAFVVRTETPDATNIAKLQHSDDNSSWSDVTNGAVAPGASDEVQVLDYLSPSKRYVRVSVARAVSTVLGPFTALLYRLRSKPAVTAVSGSVALVKVKG